MSIQSGQNFPSPGGSLPLPFYNHTHFPFAPKSSLTPWEPLICPSSIILSFPECHIVGIMQHVAFLGWLLSLSNMHLRFLHVFSGLIAHFCVIQNSLIITVRGKQGKNYQLYKTPKNKLRNIKLKKKSIKRVELLE